jgi:ubiquitin-like modifier-activating enzyme ATG7
MATKIKMIHPKAMLTLGFYTEYQNKILNEYKYENAIKPVYCYYEPKEGNSFLRFEEFSFDPSKNPQVTGKLFSIEGLLVHYSTQDSFQKLDNLETVYDCLKKNKEKYQFILFIYGDLKTFLFKFKFVLLHNKGVEYKISAIKKEIGEDLQKKLNEIAEKNKDKINEEFAHLLSEDTILLYDINSELNTIPILIKNAVYNFGSDKITNVILLKNIENNLTFKNSLYLTLQNVSILAIEKELESIQLSIKDVEVNSVDLKSMFNPETIAENAVDLNINLMKWRMCPYLNTDIIRQHKYLLIGAGTLGCHVSRALLGWGARHITFIDNGKVSYSNPVRQSLYTFEDSKNVGNNSKAILAAEKLKKIFPMVDAKGFNITIPLPGRTLIDEKAKEEYFKNLEILENQIKECDIMFLLTDSRESRWYPTVIAKAYNKLVITAAIGFDSYLVMRHGNNENKLGCYFCTDISTPGDTSGNRTLDQQCTISRPGVSMICSGLATELAMSCGNSALNKSDKEEDIPHQLRGNLINYEMQHFNFKYNTNCVACSDNIVKTYKEDRLNFAIGVMNDPYYIEKTCGIHELTQKIKIENDNDKDDF